MTDRERIEALAVRVASGEAVDWPSELGAGKGDAVLRNLQLLQRLSDSLAAQAANQDEVSLLRHLDETFDDWLADHGRAPKLPLPETWGRLRIDGVLGSGAYADVLKARDPRLERTVALKLYRTDQRPLQDKLLEEGCRLARVDHPNVVRIFEAGEHDGRVGLWMEYLQGKTLQQWVEQHGVMGTHEGRAAGRTLAGALAAVHRAGLLHRDIKAQNVIREDGGRLVLADLGSGIDQLQAAGQPALSGTPLYLAPEVLRGDSPSVRSDIYSLGVLLFYLVSGRFPFEAGDMAALQRLHEQSAPWRLRDLRPELDEGFIDAVEKAISVDPANRFGSMGELDAALAGPASPIPVSRRWRGWRLAAACAAALALGWLGWSTTRHANEMVAAQHASGYQLDAALYRHVDDGVERLVESSRLRVGDRLSLTLAADSPLYVYLFNEDERGNAFGLFPLAMLEQVNPLAAGQAHRLPGEKAGGALTWQVDRAGGTERIHLVTSPEPLPEIDALYRALPPARLAHSLLTARGIGTVTDGPAAEPVSAAPLLQAVQRISGEGARFEGAWHRVFVFAGDGR